MFARIFLQQDHISQVCERESNLPNLVLVAITYFEHISEIGTAGREYDFVRF